MNVSTSRDRLWQKRLNELSAVWPDFMSGRTTGLHKTRVASRRIREALPIVAVAAPPDKVKKLDKRMRSLTRTLGPIRELDVELALLEDRAASDGSSGRALEIVRREIASRRQALRKELEDDAPISDLKKLLKKLERVAGGKGTKPRGHKAARRIEVEWRGVLAARLMRRAKRVGAALEDAGPLYAPDRLHAVRISTKKLRYALEIARDAGAAGVAPLLKVLKRHQERLGHLHDLQMLLKHVRETETSPGAGSRMNEFAAYADSLERECRRLHAVFVDHRGELTTVVKQIRQQVVPALTTPPRRQAHVPARERSSDHARVRAK
ncbi:MAG: CHAD domain-containing protein [Acidobacteria bacterium]|nr:MAG: CHAD domain-containing protein [Acidobacteriota bacterium]